MERKLAAILSADVTGYSRLMGEDEEATLRLLITYRRVMDTLLEQHRGRIVGTAGDSVLAEFASVVDAVQCAVVIQTTLQAENANLPVPRRMEFRIGINLGDVMVEGEQIYGDGVNIAARLEGLAEPGGICISGTVHDHIKNKLALAYQDLGEQMVKNIAEPVQVWRVRMDGRAASTTPVGAALRGRLEGQRYWQGMALVGVMVLLVGAGIVVIRNLASSPSPGQPQGVAPTQTATLSEQTQALPLPDKPSIAVLPFVNLSSDPEQEYFSDGMTDDLITDLSRLSGLFVIARNSVFTYKGKAVKVEEVSRELGVQYVLEGSVRKADNRVRITAQLVDATTGHHLWAERYDRPLQEIFALQDEIVQKIVTTLKLQLTLWKQGVLVRRTTDNLEAYDYYLRGWEYYWRLTKETNAQARQMWEKAIELDPQYAAAYMALGWTYSTEWGEQWSLNPQALEQVFALAQKALALDDSLADAHRLLGWAYLSKKQYEQALTEVERGITLNPNDAFAYAWLGDILSFTGRPEEAIGLAEKALHLNPRNPIRSLTVLGNAYYLTGRTEEAIATMKRAISASPNYLPPHLTLAAIYSELGREEEAKAEVAEVLRISPNFSLEVARQRMPVKDPAVLERGLAALRKAGLK